MYKHLHELREKIIEKNKMLDSLKKNHAVQSEDFFRIHDELDKLLYTYIKLISESNVMQGSYLKNTAYKNTVYNKA